LHHGWVLPWDHNAYYHRLLLREVPAGANDVLDVGCGAGQLANKLAVRACHVDAVDSDPAMIDLARGGAPMNVDCMLADVMDTDLASSRYDAIVSMSALHHLPLDSALPRLAGALRPGGVLAVVALPRRDLPRELAVELAATIWHHLVGLALAAGGDRTTLGVGLKHSADHDQMAMANPGLTTREVRQQAASVLPGVRVRRLMLWRYLLVWHRPTRLDERLAR
jgi:SAM-dependent methyltransferase